MKNGKQWENGEESGEKRYRIRRFFRKVFLLTGLLAFLCTVGLFVYAEFFIDYTSDELLFLSAKENRTTRFYIRDCGISDVCGDEPPVQIAGFPVHEWTEERLIGAENGIYAVNSEIPDYLKKAVLASEDRRFYEHGGVDVLRTGKAALNSVFHFSGRFGASTLTQQLIKNLSGDSEVTFGRKLREIFRAIRLEKNHDKDEILEVYLNVIPLAEHCVGVRSAAETYFGKDVSKLSLAECASIVAILKAPAYYHPLRHPEANKERRDLILREMVKCGYISEQEGNAAIVAPLNTTESSFSAGKVRSYYTETVLSDIVRDLVEKEGYSESSAEAIVYGGGITVYTTMDEVMQKTLEKYFADLSHFESPDKLRYAMTVIDPRTGDLLAAVGDVGEKTGNRCLNYVSEVPLAPGSALKPLSVYAPALEKGVIRWNSVYDDVPTDFTETENGYTAWPQNANRRYSGLTTVADALAYSKNTVAVRVLRDLGERESYRFLTEELGLRGLVASEKTADGRVLSDVCPAPLALGQLTYGVTLRDLTAAYTALADGGIAHTSRSYLLVLDALGRVLLDNRAESRRVLSEENAAIMTKLLETVTDYGTASSLRLTDKVETAGKTGTAGTGENRFFIGYTPYLLAGVYCGSRDGKTPTSGSFSGHIRTFDRVMAALHDCILVREKKLYGFSLPETVVTAQFCRDSGGLSTDACFHDPRGERTAVGYFRASDIPTEDCSRHVAVLYDTAGHGVACPDCILHAPTGVETVGLLSIPERDFPTEITVADAEYVYRSYLPRVTGADGTLPYFSPILKEGHYVGRSAGERQYNAVCGGHTDGCGENTDAEKYEDSPDGNRPFFLPSLPVSPE